MSSGDKWLTFLKVFVGWWLGLIFFAVLMIYYDYSDKNRGWVERLPVVVWEWPETPFEGSGSYYLIDGEKKVPWTADVHENFPNAKGSRLRKVVDRVTGDQVWVVNEGWREDSVVHYRIMRASRIYEFNYDEGWSERKHSFSKMWVVEMRRVDELRPIPSL